MDGRYTACLSNRPNKAVKSVSFNDHASHKPIVRSSKLCECFLLMPSSSIAGIINTRTLPIASEDTLEMELNELSDLIDSVKDNQEYMIYREKSHRDSK